MFGFPLKDFLIALALLGYALALAALVRWIYWRDAQGKTKLNNFFLKNRRKMK